MHKQLKMAVVGLGTWGENHIRLYLEDFRVTVAAVCDMNPAKDFPVSIYDAANTTLTILAIMKSAESRQPVEVSQLYPIDWKKTVF